MARSNRLVILIKNIYTLWGRKRFLLPVTYFPTNLVYPFTLRVTGTIKLTPRLWPLICSFRLGHVVSKLYNQSHFLLTLNYFNNLINVKNGPFCKSFVCHNIRVCCEIFKVVSQNQEISSQIA